MAKKDFFISYTSSDELWAKWIAQQLDDAGYTTKIQCWDFITGNFVDKINDALINSERYITVISPAYFESDWCKAEWTALFATDPTNKNGILIPVMVEECKPDGLLAPIIYIKLIGLNENEAAEKLINTINPPSSKKTKPAFPGTGAAKAARVKGKPVFPPAFPRNNLTPRNINFTGRGEILDGIHKSFESGNYAALTQVVEGLGGVGKTQTALEYVYRYTEDYDVIWWINGESIDTLFLGFTDFAHESGLVGRDIVDHSIIISSVKSWMVESERWLFIFDNAEKPDDIKEYLPGMSKGNILITSRFAVWRSYKEINIDVFKPEEAADFLIKSTKIDDRNGAGELAEELGHLPLALEQAAAYISNNGAGYAEYLELYKRHRLEVFKGEMGKPKDYNSTVAVTWDISIEKIESESAKQLLNICSFFSGDRIDKSIFPECAGCLPEPLASDVKDELKYNNMIFEITKYSLIKNQGSCFSIHRLLQEVIRDSLDKKKWLEMCLKITHEKYDFDQYDMNTWNYVSSLLGHSLSIARYAEEEDFGLEEAGRIYNDSGLWFGQMAVYSEALILFMKVQVIWEKVYGEEHPYTAIIYNNIAGVYDDQGNYEKALEWYEKTLVINEKVLSKEHPSKALTYNNIASVYDDQGDYDKALEWYGKALEIYERILGKEHQSTATTYNNIALVYDKQGDYKKALEWYRRALETREKVLGNDHPSTAITYNNIALVYYNKEDYEEALEWCRKALAADEKVLGKMHPNTATDYNNIAGVYKGQGDNEKALEWYGKALEIYEKVLGKEHPLTATIYNNIALVCYNKEDYEKALEWYEKALEIREKVLGQEHPNTALIYNNIAGVYYNKKDYKKAFKFLIKACKIYIKKQMTGYPDVKVTLGTLNTVYIENGGKEENFQKWLSEKLAEEE